MIWEKAAPRNKYVSQFSSNERLRVAAGVLLTATVGLLISTALKEGLNFTPPKWGLNSNGVPLWLQAIVALILFDFLNYVFHRLQHRIDWWWQFHKVHHATREITVQAGSVTNVIDLLGSSVLPFFCLQVLLDLSPQAIFYGHSIPVGLVSGLFAHANVNFPKGRCPWWARIINNPNTHAWHHTYQGRGNFGQFFTLFDTIFGTFEAPPEDGVMEFGVDDEVFTRKNLFQQILHGALQLTTNLSRRILGVIGRPEFRDSVP